MAEEVLENPDDECKDPSWEEMERNDGGGGEEDIGVGCVNLVHASGDKGELMA